ncbi:MAG TPA: hypothetical protein VML54_01270, partial [Candidatus Limnocylindrales bacterium]|nr:hypothetical protein [Candidatus Limnocylindrales bacterium]
YLTIAGQTAPGDGITIRNGSHRSTPLRVETHDVVIRHLRIRPGPGGGPDGLSIGRGRNIVVDHCSVGWAVDENLAVTGHSYDVTVQWSIVAEGLHDSTHPKGPHSMGDLIGSRGNVSLHHNLYAHNDARNPRIGGGSKTVDFVNNVIYNFGSMAGRLSAHRLIRINYVGNVLRPGPDSHGDAVALALPKPYPIALYADGNVLPPAGLVADDRKDILVDERHPAPPVTTSPPMAAYEAVLRSAGATRPRRDAIDARIVASVRERDGRIIDRPEQVGGWIAARGGTAPADRDGDGMPDAWEVRHGFDPDDPSDGSEDADGDGYTNVEEFLNGTHPRKRTPGR